MTGSRAASIGACLVVLLLATGCDVQVYKSRAPAAAHSDYDPTPGDYAQISLMLAQRAAAVVKGDQESFLESLDPEQPTLAEQQLVLFDNFRELGVTTLRYNLDRETIVTPDAVPGDDPFFRPEVAEVVGLPHTTRKPLVNPARMTFVKRENQWYVAGDSQPRDSDAYDAPLERPWFGEPISMTTRGAMTVLMDKAEDGRLDDLADSVTDDVLVASTRLQRDPQYRLLVDATSNGFAVDFSSVNDEEAAAVTFGLLGLDRDGYGLSAYAVKVNPDLVSLATRQPGLMVHELTHFLLARVGGAAPQWASEGVADWTAYPSVPAYVLVYGDPSAVLAEDRLPIRGTFNLDPSVSYALSYGAVTYLVAQRGIDRFLDFMLEYRKRYDGPDVDALTPKLLKRFYGFTEDHVVQEAQRLLSEAKR